MDAASLGVRADSTLAPPSTRESFSPSVPPARAATAPGALPRLPWHVGRPRIVRDEPPMYSGREQWRWRQRVARKPDRLEWILRPDHTDGALEGRHPLRTGWRRSTGRR